jgi:hypothetical protein
MECEELLVAYEAKRKRPSALFQRSFAKSFVCVEFNVSCKRSAPGFLGLVKGNKHSRSHPGGVASLRSLVSEIDELRNCGGPGWIEQDQPSAAAPKRGSIQPGVSVSPTPEPRSRSPPRQAAEVASLTPSKVMQSRMRLA